MALAATLTIQVSVALLAGNLPLEPPPLSIAPTATRMRFVVASGDPGASGGDENPAVSEFPAAAEADLRAKAASSSLPSEAAAVPMEPARRPSDLSETDWPPLPPVDPEPVQEPIAPAAEIPESSPKPTPPASSPTETEPVMEPVAAEADPSPTPIPIAEPVAPATSPAEKKPIVETAVAAPPPAEEKPTVEPVVAEPSPASVPEPAAVFPEPSPAESQPAEEPASEERETGHIPKAETTSSPQPIPSESPPTNPEPVRAAPSPPTDPPPAVDEPALSPLASASPSTADAPNGPSRDTAAAPAAGVGIPVASARAEPDESNGASGLATAGGAEREKESADALLAALATLIERYKSYPRAARRARLEGVVRVRVSIDPTGHLTAYSLQEKSGHRVLDHATLKLFKRIVGERVSSHPLRRPLKVVVPVRYRHL